MYDCDVTNILPKPQVVGSSGASFVPRSFSAAEVSFPERHNILLPCRSPHSNNAIRIADYQFRSILRKSYRSDFASVPCKSHHLLTDDDIPHLDCSAAITCN